MIVVGAYIIFCIALAWVNYRIIRANRRIYHGLNGLVHLACWVIAFVITRSIYVLFMMPLVARLFFDVSLNLMRNLPMDYVPSKPKSIIDRLEKKVFGNEGIPPKLLYIVLIILLIVLYATD